MVKNREMLTVNPRIGVIYRSWDNMDEAGQNAVLSTAEHYLNDLHQL
jgi:deoxyribodipyrimidine photolyase-related protein